MSNPLTPAERLEHAQTAVALARQELHHLPPEGRQRTEIINRARGHLYRARQTLRRLHIWPRYRGRMKPPTPEQLQHAEELMQTIETLWPTPQTGRKT